MCVLNVNSPGMRKLIRCAEAIERVQDQTGLVAAVKVSMEDTFFFDIFHSFFRSL